VLLFRNCYLDIYNYICYIAISVLDAFFTIMSNFEVMEEQSNCLPNKHPIYKQCFRCGNWSF